jgi:hypothetical protein
MSIASANSSQMRARRRTAPTPIGPKLIPIQSPLLREHRGQDRYAECLRPFCCVRAKGGHASADPTITLMKSRRHMLLS